MHFKKLLFSFYLILFFENIYAQTINAEKELLSIISLGTGEGQLYYYANEEFRNKTEGININIDGELVFTCYLRERDENDNYITHSNSCSYKNGVFKVSLEERNGKISGDLKGQNINGYCISGKKLKYFKNDIFYPIELNYEEIIPKSTVVYEFIPVEKGLIVDRSDAYRNPTIIGVEVKNGKQEKIIPFSELNQWLKNQKGNYEVKDDGKLYKNEIIYSNKIINENIYRIIARLRSGHCVHTCG